MRDFTLHPLIQPRSTRPFLEDIEKKWISFQLLCAVRDCHARNVYHGDIKTENVLVTSWNWLYLSDFSSSFKPTYLPEDNPADFSFYFDTSGRRTCYVAPERFLRSNEESEDKDPINWRMDIFSVGCVIAELFLEAPIFSFHQLLSYRNEKYDPIPTHLEKIEDPEIREMVAHMIQLQPEKRFSAEEYLNFWQHRAFPEYFYSFLHQYMHLITDPTSGRKQITAGGENLGESDERIDRVYSDFDKISVALGHQRDDDNNKINRLPWDSANALFPLCIDIPNHRHIASSSLTHKKDDGTLLFLTLVVSAMRSTARATAKQRACELLLAFAERVTDEAKLDRILPFLMPLLNDKAEIVKIAALRSLTQVLSLVTVVSPINAYVFSEYIIPRLQPFVPGSSAKPSALVRATYASCIGTLATTAGRFLDMMQALRADGSLPTNDPEAEDGVVGHSMYQNLYDVAREELVTQFESQTKSFLTDNDSIVRRAFLRSVPVLCVFFGSQRANDVILSHLNTYLNDRDWMLKCAFFETVVGVAVYVGGPSLEEFILPLMVQALTDPEEFVVERVIRSFSEMARLGLFQRSTTWELVDLVAKFTMHPNIWIREAAAQMISASTKYISVADSHSIIIPLIRPYLKVLPADLSEIKILDDLKKPLPRLALDMATTWALQPGKGIFWTPVQQQRTFSLRPLEDALATVSNKDVGPKALSKIHKNDEDEKWLQKLRTLGLSADEDFKLLALRGYIWRVAHRKSQDESEKSQVFQNGIIKLTDLGLTPQTIFFEEDQDLLQQGVSSEPAWASPRTIADALLDASTTVDDPISRRKRSHINSHKEQLARQDQARDKRIGSVDARDSSFPAPTSPRDIEDARNIVQRISEDGPSSLNSSPDLRGGPLAHSLQHRNSALSLLTKADGGNKAAAETSTISTTAVGRVDGLSSPNEDLRRRLSSSPLAAAVEQQRQNPEQIKFQAAHSYVGHDPSVLRLLDAVYLQNYPLDQAQFGPLVTPIGRRHPLKRGNSQSSSNYWHPEGTLVATFAEHGSAINRVVVSPDHLFFLTGSDDGTVKVWDTGRLEKNITHRSRLTHKHAPGSKVTGLAFIENTHCFVSTGSDGSVHIVKVDTVETAQGTLRYSRLRVLREHQLPSGQFGLWIEHYKNENQSIVLIATNTSRVVALDLRTMTILYELKNPLHHGTPTCICVDRKRHWLLLGTSHGVMDLWDLRFQLRLRGWALQGATPINRITLSPVRGSSRHRIIVAGGTGQGEITLWDLEKLTCREVLRCGNVRDAPRTYRLIDVDEERAGGMLDRFDGQLDPSASASVDRGVRAIAVAPHITEDNSEPRYYFILSAGPDWKVRFWDGHRYEASAVISGMEPDEGKPTYTVQSGPEPLVVTEKLAPPLSAAASAIASPGTSRASSNTSGRRERRAPSRSSIVSLQQQHLLKSHTDTIQDIALLEYPYGMIVSVDRSGVVYIFS